MVPQQHRGVGAVNEQEQGIAGVSAMPSVSFSRSAFFRVVSITLIVGIPALILVLFVLYPLAAIILQSIFPDTYAINPDLNPSFSAISQVFSDPLNYQALGNSLWLSAVTAVLASAIGTILAVLARRTDLPLRGAMDTMVWVVFFFPSFLIGEAWSLTLIRGGIPDQFLHFSDGFINWFFSPI